MVVRVSRGEERGGVEKREEEKKKEIGRKGGGKKYILHQESNPGPFAR